MKLVQQGQSNCLYCHKGEKDEPITPSIAQKCMIKDALNDNCKNEGASLCILDTKKAGNCPPSNAKSLTGD